MVEGERSGAAHPFILVVEGGNQRGTALHIADAAQSLHGGLAEIAVKIMQAVHQNGDRLTQLSFDWDRR